MCTDSLSPSPNPFAISPSTPSWHGREGDAGVMERDPTQNHPVRLPSRRILASGLFPLQSHPVPALVPVGPTPIPSRPEPRLSPPCTLACLYSTRCVPLRLHVPRLVPCLSHVRLCRMRYTFCAAQINETLDFIVAAAGGVRPRGRPYEGETRYSVTKMRLGARGVGEVVRLLGRRWIHSGDVWLGSRCE